MYNGVLPGGFHIVQTVVYSWMELMLYNDAQQVK